MLIRPAAAADAHSMAVVHVRSWQAAYRGLMPQDVLDALSIAQREAGWHDILANARSSRTLVAEHDGNVIGWASFGDARDQDAVGTGELWGIYVHPESWSTGAGHALLIAVERELIAAGHSRAYLWVLRGNERAAVFYERHDWVADGGAKVDSRPGLRLSELRHAKLLRRA